MVGGVSLRNQGHHDARFLGGIYLTINDSNIGVILAKSLAGTNRVNRGAHNDPLAAALQGRRYQLYLTRRNSK